MIFGKRHRATRAMQALLALCALGSGLTACGGGGGGGGGGGSPRYAIGGTISGLTGSGLVLRNNNGDDLIVSAGATSFQFATALTNNSAYAVTVQTHPSTPAQTCTVANASGTVPGADVSNVQITCSTNGYLIGGTVTGLVGTGLELRLNGGNNLIITDANRNFTFSSAVASGATYTVSVLNQPTSPAQTCSVSNETGTVGGTNVGNVIVACVTDTSSSTYTVGGTVSGLTGSGLVLQINGSDNKSVASTDSSFTFATALTDGSDYTVTVLTQPSSPTQTCTVANSSGAIAGGNVSTVAVTCSTVTHTISGNVSGLSGTGLVLQLNGNQNLSVGASGGFTFTAPVADGSPYSVAVLTQPTSPSQTCSVSNSTGTASGNVSNVAVSCATNTYTVSVTVAGVSGSGLVLQNNSADNLSVTTNGSYTFATPVASGATYSVSVATQPSSPTQTCTVANATGTIASSNLTNVVVTCSTNTYTVGGSVSNLAGTLVLRLNNGNNISVTVSGGFTFGAIADGSAYNVTVFSTPALQTCVVGNGSGTLNGGNVGNVTVTCTTQIWSGIKQYGTPTDDVGNVVAVDSGGDVIVAGCANGALKAIGNLKTTCDTRGGNANIVVRKYNSIGEWQWTDSLSSLRNSQANSVVTDALGNIYVTGFTEGALAGQTFVNGKDVFLIKYNAAGTRLWTYEFGGLGDDQGNALALDTDGNLYIAGTTYGNLDGAHPGNASYDAFVTRINAANLAGGTPPASRLWLVQLGSVQVGSAQANDFGLGIAVDTSGSVYISGTTLGNLNGEVNQGSPNGNEDVFVVKLDPANGSAVWTKEFGTIGNDLGSDVGVDTTGNVYVAGYTGGSFPTFTNVSGVTDLFVRSYDSGGTSRWLQQLTSSGHDLVTDMAVDASGNLLISGYSQGNFGGNTNAGTLVTTSDAFAVKYNSTGTLQWTRLLGTPTDDKAYGIATNASGEVFITGYTLGGFDGAINQGGADLFVTKYSASGARQ